jgi:hypothetical protein
MVECGSWRDRRLRLRLMSVSENATLEVTSGFREWICAGQGRPLVAILLTGTRNVQKQRVILETREYERVFFSVCGLRNRFAGG